MTTDRGPIPTLDDYRDAFQVATRQPKEYGTYLPTVTTFRHPVILRVDLGKLNLALRGDEDWAARVDDRNPSTFIPGRYARRLEQVRAGNPIEPPWLHFRDGRIRVMDGRHRLYALIDEGYTHVTVAIDPEWAAPIATVTDMHHDDVKAIEIGNDHDNAIDLRRELVKLLGLLGMCQTSLSAAGQQLVPEIRDALDRGRRLLADILDHEGNT